MTASFQAIAFGMVASGAPGWTGEDCLNGLGDYQICHGFHMDLTLNEVCAPADVVAGSTTLFDASLDSSITYYLGEGSTCLVWGPDAPYYAALGCHHLTR